MTDDQKAIQLQQLANIVIDAYVNREHRFIPEFEPGTKGIMFLVRPEGEKDHPKLELNFMYRRSDYEPENRS